MRGRRIPSSIKRQTVHWLPGWWLRCGGKTILCSHGSRAQPKHVSIHQTIRGVIPLQKERTAGCWYHVDLLKKKRLWSRIAKLRAVLRRKMVKLNDLWAINKRPSFGKIGKGPWTDKHWKNPYFQCLSVQGPFDLVGPVFSYTFTFTVFETVFGHSIFVYEADFFNWYVLQNR